MICETFVIGSCPCGAKFCKRCGHCHNLLCDLQVARGDPRGIATIETT